MNARSGERDDFIDNDDIGEAIADFVQPLINYVPEAEYCLFCGRRRVAVARYRMICLVLIYILFHENHKINM